MSNEEIKQYLYEISEKKYRDFSSSLIPNCREMIGVRIPKLREFAKKIAKEDYNAYLKNACDETFEEVLLQGFVIGYCKCDINQRIKYIKEFVPKIDDWSINDCFCATLKFTVKNRDRMWDLILFYLKSDKEFELRFATIMMMDYFLIDEYIDKVLIKLDSIQNDGYYIKMGVAWAIATSYAKFPEKTHKYLCTNNSLDDFTFNKAIQKMLESYRVSDENKIILKKLKRNK